VLAKGDCVYACTLFVLNLDEAGSAPVTLTSMAAQPAWSPDGKQIAFVSMSGDDGYHALHVINADGSGLRVVVPRDEGFIDRAGLVA
jgi:Tol biopolymer transport system component